ncbi:MAG: response regulator [Chlorobiales bacterium]
MLNTDEPMVLSSLSRLLEDDYIVHTASGGAQAMEIVKREPIKVVISDQRMPGMLGHEVLRQIKLISPNTIRMLLTGYSDLDAIISSVNAGEIFRYINKPWKADNLCNLVKLGIQIYDRITHLQAKEQAKAESQIEESALRLRLRAAQALLSKTNLRNES